MEMVEVRLPQGTLRVTPRQEVVWLDGPEPAGVVQHAGDPEITLDGGLITREEAQQLIDAELERRKDGRGFTAAHTHGRRRR